MSSDLSSIRKIYEKIKTASDNAALTDAKFSARRFVRNLDDEQIERLRNQGLDIYGDGEDFKDSLLASFEEEINNNKAGQTDESIFTKSMDDISKMDLSQENIYNILHGNEQEDDEIKNLDKAPGETLDNESDDTNIEEDDDEVLSNENNNETLQDDENLEFYMLLEAMYNDPMLNGVIDADGDGEISNEEAQTFLKNINIDGDSENFSLNDITEFINKAANTLTKEEKEEIDKAIEQGVQPQATISTNSPYVTSGGYSGGSSTGSTGANNEPTKTSEEKKGELTQQIEQYKQELADIQSGKDPQVEQAINDKDSAKEAMDEALEKDENITSEQKEQFDGYIKQIDEFDSQIGEVDSQLSQLNTDLSSGKNNLASLQAALNSLAAPSGKEEDKAADEKLNARKKELEGQIEKQQTANNKLENEDIPKLEEQKQDLVKQKEEVENQKAQLEEKMLENASEETKQAIEKYNEAQENIEQVKQTRTQEVEAKLQSAQTELKQVEDEIQTNANKQAENNFSADFEEMLDKVFEAEGGFGNHPNDHGGATNMGITQATYNSWLQSQGLGSKSVAGITKEEATQIYYDNFFVSSGANKYAEQGNSAYAYALFDAAVNHGVGGAAKIDAQAQGDVDKFMELRKQKYINIVANDPSQAVFAKGWQNRWNNVYSYIDPNHEYENYIGR